VNYLTIKYTPPPRELVDMMLNPLTRALAVGMAADALRAGGAKDRHVVAVIQRIHHENGKPVPTAEEIDWWLEESDLLTSRSDR